MCECEMNSNNAQHKHKKKQFLKCVCLYCNSTEQNGVCVAVTTRELCKHTGNLLYPSPNWYFDIQWRCKGNALTHLLSRQSE